MLREENPVEGFLIGKVVSVDTEERNGSFLVHPFLLGNKK